MRTLSLLLLLLISTTSFASELDTTPLAVKTVRAFPNLQRIERPIIFDSPRDGTNRVAIASQLGKIYMLANDDAATQAELFLDLSAQVVYKSRENEEGFLGMAFHPQYKKNGKFYVYYTSTEEPHLSKISEFTASQENPNRADLGSERELMRIPQPYWNHNGGTIVFGPDGYLYIGLGDGGLGNDPHNNGQNLQTWLGSILRIDVDRPTDKRAYGIPSDNPFLGQDQLARPEIWAYGFRNVWRIAFDRETHLLWAADVGQNLWEEIDIVHRGGNYGWNLREGQHQFSPQGVSANSRLVEPIFEYHHDIGKSITGGTVYRGKQIPALVGKYVYADYVTGFVWALDYDQSTQKVLGNHVVAEKQMPIITFGEDENNELYYCTDSHTIHRFVPAN
ncbi:MAG: PQQ-dependent sugar dehydrogenase [Planctomycetales bacterium]|nr:PQQ-dependent sugar dehydrogenase [Planctomycetales bacterium]